MYYSYIITTLLIFVASHTPLCLPAEQTLPPTIINHGADPIFHHHTYNAPVSYTITISTENITKYYTNWVQNNVATAHQEPIKKIIKRLLWEKKYKIAAGALVGCYGATCYRLLSDYYFITTKDLWSQWKSDCSFEQLCALSQQELSKELLLAIGQRTFTHKNTKGTHPLMSFIISLNNEIKHIERYIKTAKTIKRLGLMGIFPTNESKIEHAAKLFERAHFIKHIFLSWFAEHNFNA